MALDEDLKLERYKLVTDRQKYFTELARDSFASYMKILTGLAVGSMALISSKSRLDLSVVLLSRVVYTVAGLVSFLGIIAILQICFCLARWKGYRQSERKINPESPPIKPWFWLFEGLYCVAIAISLIAVWLGSWCLLSAIPGK